MRNIDQGLQTGIDGVFFNPNGNPQFIITESKFRTTPPRSPQDLLSNTRDGLQLSDSWITGEVTRRRRLRDEVGRDLSRQILLEGYERKLVHINPLGEVTIHELDYLGNIVYGN